MRFMSIAAIGCMLLALNSHAAETIFIGGAVGPFSQPLHTVNPATGAATVFGVPVGLMEGMSFDTLRGRIVATQRNSNQIKTIDPISGVVGNLAASTPTFLEGLAYDANRDTFWATEQTSGNLYRINPVTGITTLATGAPLGGGAVHPGGLGFDPAGDWIYGVDDDRLYRISPTTFAATAIGPAGFGIGFTDVDAAEFDTATGLLYIVNDYGSGGNPAILQQFASLDPATGLGTLIGPTGLPEQFGQGMAIIAPEPGSLAAMSVVVMLMRRRRAQL